ncbi:MAG: hypothetical protein ACE5PM_00090 [Candidatus Hydrothermarchaeales archaeon]
MQKVCILYSGGKDGSLASYILEKMGYDVQLVTANFGVLDSWKYAKKSADALGFDHRILRFEKDVAERAMDIIVKDGYPNNGINYIHKRVLSNVAEDFELIADGTRKDDRVPWLNVGEIRSLEDSSNCQYLTPLRGIGYKTIDALAHALFEIEEGESEDIPKGDYEAEIRALLKERCLDPGKFFPSHIQSRVLGWKKGEQS